MNIYGVVDQNNAHHDVSTSEHDAKQYAIVHGFTKVSVRRDSGHNVDIIAERSKGDQRWYPAWLVNKMKNEGADSFN